MVISLTANKTAGVFRIRLLFSMVLILLVGCQNMTAQNTPLSYPMENIDIQTDTLADIVRLYGEPIGRSETSAKLLKYDYGSFQVTAIPDGKLNSIMIQTRDFTDQNGLSVGDRRQQVVQTIAKQAIIIDSSGAWIADSQQKIIYWFDGDRVSMIVLAADLGQTPS